MVRHDNAQGGFHAANFSIRQVLDFERSVGEHCKRFKK
jgi:hypothetical protein